MELKATANIKHNGKWYKPGDEIKKVKKEDGERLIKLGVAKVDEEAAAIQKALEEVKKKEEAAKLAAEQVKKEAEEKAKAEADEKKKETEQDKKEAKK